MKVQHLPLITLAMLACLTGCAPRTAENQGSRPSAVVKQPPSGQELYQRHGCALCHGPKGRGDGPVSATLYPPARDLRDKTTYRIGATEEVIATTIEQGILVFGGSGMTPFAHIPADERLELARYIVSLQEHEKEPNHEP